MAEDIICPFCGFKTDDQYVIQLHIEEHHTEDSPFAVSEASCSLLYRDDTFSDGNTEADNPWLKCTRPDCGEYMMREDIDEHLELHEAAVSTVTSERGNSSGHAKRRKTSSGPSSVMATDRSLVDEVRRSPSKLEQSRHQHSNNASRNSGGILNYFVGRSHYGPPPKRITREPRPRGHLGRRELGPHAFEKAMPDTLKQHLLNDALPRSVQRLGERGKLIRDVVVPNETSGLIPIVADFCQSDATAAATYLCDASVRHVTKLRCDGNFCGYWNIQMLLSCIQARRGTSPDLQNPLPNVLQIQETIEQAWDNGICSFGRIETGGILNTRKWIGTNEAVAYFTQTSIRVEALSFKTEENDNNKAAAASSLLDHIEAYFMSGLEGARRQGISAITSLPPIYFQRLGHSMTIIGLERKLDGSRNLLVFDPSLGTSVAMRKLLDGGKTAASVDTLLKAYRRSVAALSRWDEFEIVV